MYTETHLYTNTLYTFSPYMYIIHVHVPVGPNVEAISSSLMARPLLDDGVQIQVMFEVRGTPPVRMP